MSSDCGSVDPFSSSEEKDTAVSQAADVIEVLPSKSPSTIGEADSNGGGSTMEGAFALEQRDGRVSASLDVQFPGTCLKSKSGVLTLLVNHDFLQRPELQVDLKSSIERELNRLEKGILAGRIGDEGVLKNDNSAAEGPPSQRKESSIEAHFGAGPSQSSHGSLPDAKHSSASSAPLVAVESETPGKGEESKNSATTLTTLCCAPKILQKIYYYLPPKDQKALSSTSPQLYDILRNLWLDRPRTYILAKLDNSADVQAFSRLIDKVGEFEELVLDLDCQLGPEFNVDPVVVTVTTLRCNFTSTGSIRDSLSKLSVAFPSVTDLTVWRVRHLNSESFAENVAELSMSWSLNRLHVGQVPLSLFTGCVSSLTSLQYSLYQSECVVMYRIPSAMFTACKDSLESMNVFCPRHDGVAEFEVCHMADLANLTKVWTLHFNKGVIIGSLNVHLMPPTVMNLHHRGQYLI